MKRRTFLSAATIPCAMGIAEKSSAQANSAIKKSPANRKRILRLPGAYYRHYPVDFSRGAKGALGFKGWGESVEIAVPAEETALVPMHIWNIGFSPELPFSPEGPAGGVMEMLEWASRSVPRHKE